MMSTDSQQLVARFDALPIVEQREVMAELLNKTAKWDALPLTDDDLVRLADDVFVEMDRREAAHGG